jgi:hypothetical protein
MILQEYWKIQEQEKDLLKEIAKWRYRAKHFSESKLFLSDKQLEAKNYEQGTLTAKQVLQEYKDKLKALRTSEYKHCKRFLHKKELK